MNRGLTKRQEGVFNYLMTFIEERGYPPSLREICARFNIKGPKNARKHLEALEKKGLIKRSPNISRAIEVFDIARRNTVSVPVAGRIRAGSPDPAIEDIQGYVTLDKGFFKCRDAFLLKVEGRSMVDAGIEEGDYILVRPQKDAENGDIVVALLEGEATVKRFFRHGSSVILKPENPEMEPISIGKKHGELNITGKVISVIKKVDT